MGGAKSELILYISQTFAIDVEFAVEKVVTCSDFFK